MTEHSRSGPSTPARGPRPRGWQGRLVTAALGLLMAGPALALDSAAPAATAVKPVDINRASRAQLMRLPGIGAAEAERIIAARPYPSKAKLLAEGVLSEPAYRALKGRIVAVPMAQATARPDRPR